MVRMAALCDLTHSLPGPGGIMDQDFFLMWVVEMVVGIQREKQQQDQERQQARSKRSRR